MMHNQTDHIFNRLRETHMGQMKNAYKILVRKPEGKGRLGRPRHRWQDNIIMHLRETELEGVDWIHLTQVWTSDGLL